MSKLKIMALVVFYCINTHSKTTTLSVIEFIVKQQDYFPNSIYI